MTTVQVSASELVCCVIWYIQNISLIPYKKITTLLVELGACCVKQAMHDGLEPGIWESWGLGSNNGMIMPIILDNAFLAANNVIPNYA